MAEPADTPDLSRTLYQRLLSRLRLRHLQLLVEISEQGSLHGAAERIGMTQPSATHAIGEIERLLEVELFERHSRGVRPNTFGRLITDYARSSLRGLQRATASLDALRRADAIVLRVGAIEAASRFLGQALPAFGERHPGIRLQVIEEGNRDLLPQLLSGQLDLALCRRLPDCPPNVEQVALLPDRTVLVAGPQHPLAGRAGLGLDALYAYPWVIAPEGTESHALFEQWVSAHGGPRLDSLSTTSMPLLAELLKDGRRLALLPLSLAGKLADWGRAVVLDVRPDAGMAAAMPPITLCRNAADRSEAVALLHAALVAAAAREETAVSKGTGDGG